MSKSGRELSSTEIIEARRQWDMSLVLKEIAANLEFFNVKLTFQNENEKVNLRKNKIWKVIVWRNKSNWSLEDAHERKNNPHLTPVSMFKHHKCHYLFSVSIFLPLTCLPPWFWTLCLTTIFAPRVLPDSRLMSWVLDILESLT